MKLTDFLEEPNPGAEKAFGDNAEKMIDSLFYAKLPLKLKRSVNMARLEYSSQNEIVAHLERELELNAPEESDDLPTATMTSSTSKQKTPSLQWTIIRHRLQLLQGKGSNGQRLRETQKEKEEGCPKGQTNSKDILNVGLVAKLTTLRNYVGKVQGHTSSLNVTGLKTHRITIRIQKRKKSHYNFTSFNSQSSSKKDDA